MKLNRDDLIKIIILVNAKNDGWTIIYKDPYTFYLIKAKNNKELKFSQQMINLCKKPLNLEKVLNELNNKKNL